MKSWGYVLSDPPEEASLGPEYRMYKDLMEREARAWAQLRQSLDEVTEPLSKRSYPVN